MLKAGPLHTHDNTFSMAGEAYSEDILRNEFAVQIETDTTAPLPPLTFPTYLSASIEDK